MKTGEISKQFSDFVDDYHHRLSQALDSPGVKEQLLAAREIIVQASENGRATYFAGNGASAAIASHCALDFTKQAGVRSVCFNDAALLTAFGNDYGYERWVEKALGSYAVTGDVAVLISSSGRSPNMLNAARYANANDIALITLSGKDKDNPLKALGKVNLWANSQSYNIVENIHSFWLSLICDSIIGKAEYSVS